MTDPFAALSNVLAANLDLEPHPALSTIYGSVLLMVAAVVVVVAACGLAVMLGIQHRTKTVLGGAFVSWIVLAVWFVVASVQNYPHRVARWDAMKLGWQEDCRSVLEAIADGSMSFPDPKDREKVDKVCGTVEVIAAYSASRQPSSDGF